MIHIRSKNVAATIMAGILLTNAVVTPLTVFASELKPTVAHSQKTPDKKEDKKDLLSESSSSISKKEEPTLQPGQQISHSKSEQAQPVEPAQKTSQPKPEELKPTEPEKKPQSKKEISQKSVPSSEKQEVQPIQVTPATPNTEDDYLPRPVDEQEHEQSTSLIENEDPSVEVKTDDKVPTPQQEKEEQVSPLTRNTEISSTNVDKLTNDTNHLISHKYAQDMTTEGFISSIAEQCREVGQEKHLYASVMIAQAILESGSGRSKLAETPNNNLFGIKGSWTDKNGNLKSVSFDTKEDDGTGHSYSTHAKFRKYDTIKDSLEDYAQLLTDPEKGMGDFYKDALKTDRNTYKDVCVALQGKYATDTTYAQKLVDLIDTYDLTQYDKPLGYELVGQIHDPKAPKELLDQFGYRKLTMNDYANLEATITAQLGEKYVWGAQDPTIGFDCSGLVWYSYKNALGVDLPRTAQGMSQQGDLVKDFNDLRMGDLLFFSRNDHVYHVAMYLGNGYFIHSPKPGDYVRITALKDYMPSFAKRVLTFENKKAIEERIHVTFDTHNLQEF